jgi:hypothetical protein
MEPTEHRGISDQDPVSELTVNFAETARVLFAAGSVTATLSQVVGLAVATIEGCDFAGLFLADRDADTNLGRTDPLVTAIDALQQRTGEGPSLDAIGQGLMIYADDLAEDPRWPRFGPGAAAAGMRSVLALPLATNGSVGVLNLFGASRHECGSI